jgi:hypothetical protein
VKKIAWRALRESAIVNLKHRPNEGKLGFTTDNQQGTEALSILIQMFHDMCGACVPET